MTTDPYDELMVKHGGRLRQENVLEPSAWAEFSLVKMLLTFWLDIDKRQCERRKAWQNSPIGIEFDLLANVEVNALAAANPDVDGIGLNAGLVAFVENAYYSLLSLESFLPAVGSPNDGKSPQEIADCIASCDVIKGWGFCATKDKDRKKTAFLLSRLAELFILYHEVSHICYGHLLHASLRSSSGASFFLEYSKARRSEHDRLHQAMEFDADEGAVAGSLGIALSMYDKWDSIGRLFAGRAPEALAPRDVIYHWVGSISVLFRVFDLFMQTADFDVTSSHPPPGPRTDHAVYCGREWVRTQFPQHLEVFENTATRASADVSDAWETLKLPAVTHAVSAKERYEFAQALRDEMLRLDKVVLEDLLRKKGEMVEKRFASQ